VALLTAFVQVGFRQSHQPSRNQVATPKPSAPAPTATPNLAAERLIPATLLIPKVGVRATVEQLTVDSNGDMASPQNVNDVGWYAPGVAPGQNGDAVVDGHLNWYGVPEAVFFNLRHLQPGDQVDVISQGGVTLHFQVTNSTSVSRTATPAGLFATSGPARLTLITCAGDWNVGAGEYDQRLLVDAAYVGKG
jgi:LPXTG-site transpeptidase (sortase) family protein